MYTIIETGKMNNVDPKAWLADVLARFSDHSAKRAFDRLNDDAIVDQRIENLGSTACN